MVKDLTEISVRKLLDPKKAVKNLRLNDEHSLSTTVLLENFLLLNTRSRQVSMFYVEKREQYKKALSLAKELGLGFKIVPFYSFIPKEDYIEPELLSYRAFTFTEEEKAKEIDRTNIKNPTSLMDIYVHLTPLSHKNVGCLIGYDTCCYLTYAEDMSLLVDPDERAFCQVSSSKEKKRAINPDSFYFEEFVPCKPDCERAIAKGRKYEHDLRTQVNDAVANIYRKLKLEHLKDVEERRILEKKRKGKKKKGVDFP